MTREAGGADPASPAFDSEAMSWGHTAADPKCSDCWDGWPKPCAVKGCGGLVHANFGDYVGSIDDDSYGYYLNEDCDRRPGEGHSV